MSVRSCAVEGPEARYDAIADWYVEFTAAWPSEPIALLPWLFETSDVLPARRDPRFDDDLRRAIFRR